MRGTGLEGRVRTLFGAGGLAPGTVGWTTRHEVAKLDSQLAGTEAKLVSGTLTDPGQGSVAAPSLGQAQAKELARLGLRPAHWHPLRLPAPQRHRAVAGRVMMPANHAGVSVYPAASGQPSPLSIRLACHDAEQQGFPVRPHQPYQLSRTEHMPLERP